MAPSRQGPVAGPTLEVGFLASDGEDRTHFAAWCVVSSPVVLGHNISDQTQTFKIWPIITNEQAIGVNQKFAGHPGGLVTSWNLDSRVHPSTGSFAFSASFCNAHILAASGDHIQYWAKPQPNNSVAILIINNNLLFGHDAAVDLSLVDMRCSPLHQCVVHDIWLSKDLPSKVSSSTCVHVHPFTETALYSHFIFRFKTGNIPPHDSKFYIVSPA
jgi:hypothetical protein